jgi:iron complex outermembrane receptor protein
MKRRIIAALVSLNAGVVCAQSTPMEHVLVTVPLHKKSSETALPVTVLSGENLKKSASASLGDTLALQPGLNNASFGPGVGQPVIRGQQGARVTVLQNGTVSADAANLSADHAVAVEPMLADSIEVLRGPATLLYGGGAIGGVVNVVDGRIPSSLVDQTESTFETRYDSANESKTVVYRLDAANGDFGFHLDAIVKRWDDMNVPKGSAVPLHEEHEEVHEDAPVDDHDDHLHEEYEGPLSRLANTDGESDIVTAGMSRHFEKGFIGFSVQRQEANYGIPAAAHAHAHEEDLGIVEEENPEEGIRIDLVQTRYDMALHWHDLASWAEQLRVFLAHTNYEHKEVEPSGEVGTVYGNESDHLRVEVVHQDIGPWHGVFGLQMGDSTFSALGEEAFIPPTDQSQLGLFWVEDLHLGASTFEFGLRFDRDEREPLATQAPNRTFDSVSASASWVRTFSDGWQLGVSLASSERAPAIEELYSNTGLQQGQWMVHAATEAIELGDDRLDTERSNNVDITWSRSWDGHYVELVAYYNQFADYIGLLDMGLEQDAVQVYAYEQTDADFYGIEFTSDWSLGEFAGGDLSFKASADVSRAKFADGQGYVPRMPAARLISELQWQGARFDLWGRAVHAFEQDRVAFNEEPTAAYTRIDFGIDMPLGGDQWTVFASVNNLTDDEIRLSTSFLKDLAPEHGRAFEFGIRGSF